MVAVISALSVALPAQAADDVAGSIPRPRAELTTQPSEVRLAFTMALSAGDVTVTSASGRNVVGSNAFVEINNISVALQNPVPRGTYTVRYRVTAEQGGRNYGGSYQFSVGPGQFTQQPEQLFGGPSNIPSSLAGSVPPRTAATPSATPSAPGATPSGSPTDGTGGATPGSDDLQGAAARRDSDPSPWPWLAAATALVAGAFVVVARKRLRAS